MLAIIKIVSVLQILCQVLAIPGFTNFGKEFVVLPPRCIDSVRTQRTTLSLMTPAEKATVDIFLPAIFEVSPAKVKHVLLVKNKPFIQWCHAPWEGWDSETKNYGFQKSIIVRSNVIIRVTQFHGCRRANKPYKLATRFEVMPKQSCQKTYYVTSLGGFSIMLVSAFDKDTNFTVKFPLTTGPYKSECVASDICGLGKEVSVQLKKYETWFLFIREWNADFQNAVVRADNPVFVVSGNIRAYFKELIFVTGRKMNIGADDQLTHAKPKLSWGKTYIVPVFRLPRDCDANNTFWVAFRVNIDAYPFEFWMHKKTNKRKYTVKNDDFYANVEMCLPLIATADKPFALSLIYGPEKKDMETWRRDYMDIQSLIPVEQWMNVNIDNVNTHGKVLPSSVPTVVISTTRDVVLTGTNNQPIWIQLQLKTVAGSEVYHYGFVSGVPAKIYTTKPGEKLIVYKMSVWGGGPYYYGLSIRALGFYQGVINQETCRKVKPVLSDGFDNDCDGNIDEEAVNGKDDDGDGAVDEDTAMSMSASPAKWTEWVNGCLDFCNGKQIVHKVRSCSQPYAFGPSCEGVAQSCHPLKTCPTKCNVSIGVRCKPYSEGCVRGDDPTVATCHHCKDGYFQDDFCLVKCPFGWSGPVCDEGPRSIDELEAIIDQLNDLDVTGNNETKGNNETHDKNNSTEPRKHSSSFTEWPYVLFFVLAGLHFCVSVHCLIMEIKRRPGPRGERGGRRGRGGREGGGSDGGKESVGDTTSSLSEESTSTTTSRASSSAVD